MTFPKLPYRVQGQSFPLHVTQEPNGKLRVYADIFAPVLSGNTLLERGDNVYHTYIHYADDIRNYVESDNFAENEGIGLILLNELGRRMQNAADPGKKIKWDIGLERIILNLPQNHLTVLSVPYVEIDGLEFKSAPEIFFGGVNAIAGDKNLWDGARETAWKHADINCTSNIKRNIYCVAGGEDLLSTEKIQRMTLSERVLRLLQTKLRLSEESPSIDLSYHICNKIVFRTRASIQMQVSDEILSWKITKDLNKYLGSLPSPLSLSLEQERELKDIGKELKTMLQNEIGSAMAR